MLYPSPKFLGRGPELHWIWRIRALHHHALEEITAERTIRSAKPLVKGERIGVVSAPCRRQDQGSTWQRARWVAVEN